MIARPTAVTGSFLALAIGLLLAAIPVRQNNYWIREIDGTSMTPTLWGERVAFRCRHCEEWLCFDRKTAERRPLLPCDRCGAWQIVPKSATYIRADRVIVGPTPKQYRIAPGAIVVIHHPKFGLTIKRVASITNGKHFVVGDSKETSVDSRDGEFGLVSSEQIRGIVVKILPAILASTPKAK